jgi:cytochrome c553
VPLASLALGGPPAATADVAAGRRKAAEVCAACHGPDGHSPMPLVPSLAGQPPFYTHWQLVLFRDGRRRDPQMSAVAQALTDEDIAGLAAYYATLRPRSGPAAPGPLDATAGRRLAQAHRCDACHAPELPEPRYTPHLAGLSYEYLVAQLRGFKARTRGELDDSTMTTVAQALSDQEIETLARYYAASPRD